MSKVSFRHLRRLTDDTGILEHSIGNIPRRKEGYSTDDQARALWACVQWLELLDSDREAERNLLTELIDTYIAFLLWVQKENGHFHNNIAYDRSKEEESPSDDCLGRCIWATAYSFKRVTHPDRCFAIHSILKRAVQRMNDLQSPRGIAYALATINELADSDEYKQLTAHAPHLTEKLMDGYETYSNSDWLWYESILAYSNAVLPWGMFCAYELLQQEKIRKVAEQSLQFLLTKMMSEQGYIRPIGNKGWCTQHHHARWDQQPIDVMKLALAASKAYAITKNEDYKHVILACRQWFYGKNDASLVMVNEEEGGCHDALCDGFVNRNQGAESTLSYLLTEAIYEKTFGHQKEEAKNEYDSTT